MIFFGEVHGFLPVSRIGLFGENRSYLPLETPTLQEIILSKTNSMLTGKQCAKYCIF
jgi:hypothetical protein